MAEQTRLLVHAGFPKTGSSALQYWLDTHASELAAAGVIYPREGRSAQDAPGHVTAGNGKLLGQYLVPRLRHADFDTIGFPDKFRRRFLPQGAARVVISHEQIAEADPDMLRRFRDEVVPDVNLIFVIFIRDIYNAAYASWTQRIKRHIMDVEFSEYMSFFKSPIKNLRKFFDVMGTDSLQIIHYESVAGDIVQALLNAIGITGSIAPETRVRRINRSLSDLETRVLAECGRTHGQRKIARLLSNHFMDQHWATASTHTPDPTIVREMEQRFASEIDWVNETFFAGHKVFGVGGQPKADRGEPAAMDEAWIWREVALVLAKGFSERLGRKPSREELRARPKKMRAEHLSNQGPERPYAEPQPLPRPDSSS